MPIMAAKNTSVALGEPFIEFARRKVESGEFATTSEVVREAMRRYVAEDIQLQALRDAIREGLRSEEHTSELQSLMRTSYAVFCLKKKHNMIDSYRGMENH